MNRGAPHSTLSARQRKILSLTEQNGFVTIESLAEEFGVSAQTIRRDIIALADAGRLQRFHGGAGPTETLRLDHGQKEQLSVEDKVQVAQTAAALVPDGASVFLDVGTTVEMAAKALNARAGFRVFTNSMRAALAFDPSRHDVNVLGRRVAGRDGSLVGEEIMLALQGLRLDYTLIGCSAVDGEGRVMDFDLSKIAVKKAAMQAAEKSLLLAASSKFGRSALSTIAMLSDFDMVVDSGRELEAGTG
jgi:DeoR family glycerol-3-phosphate regulon repressor